MSELAEVALGAAYVLLALVALILAKIVRDIITPYALDEELTTKDNHAVGLAVTGYYAAVMIIFLGASAGPEPEEMPPVVDLLVDMAVVLGYTVGGVFALNLGRMLLNKCVLHRFDVAKELLEDRNVGTGAAVFGALVATGLIVAGAINGEGGGPLTAVVFFALGQLVLVAFGIFYQKITRYDFHDEIEKDNVAAGVAFGGNMVALGVLLFGANSGDFIGWADNLEDFAYYAVAGFLMLMALRWIVDLVLLPGTTLHHEIANDRNLNAAWIEGIVAIGMSVVIVVMI